MPACSVPQRAPKVLVSRAPVTGRTASGGPPRQRPRAAGGLVGRVLHLSGGSLLGAPLVAADRELPEPLGGVGVGDGLGRLGGDAQLLGDAHRVARVLHGLGGRVAAGEPADADRADEGGGQEQRGTTADRRRTAPEEARPAALGGRGDDLAGQELRRHVAGGDVGLRRHLDDDGCGSRLDGLGALVGRRADRGDRGRLGRDRLRLGSRSGLGSGRLRLGSRSRLGGGRSPSRPGSPWRRPASRQPAWRRPGGRSWSGSTPSPQQQSARRSRPWRSRPWRRRAAGWTRPSQWRPSRWRPWPTQPCWSPQPS